MHALHHDVRHRAIFLRCFTGVIDGHDIGLVEPRRVLSFAAETLEKCGVASQVGSHHLDGDVTGEQFIGRSVHIGHSAGADFGV